MFDTFIGLVPLPRIRPTFLRAPRPGELSLLVGSAGQAATTSCAWIYPFEPKRSPP